MNTQPIFSSIRQTWRTPKAFYNNLNHEFEFDFDPCPPDPEFDGLHCEWGTTNFVNPPYNQIKKWLGKTLDEYNKGKTIVLLLPSRTGTDWFHKYVLPFATEIKFIRGRLKFDDQENCAPFDSMVVVYKPDSKPPTQQRGRMELNPEYEPLIKKRSMSHTPPLTAYTEANI